MSIIRRLIRRRRRKGGSHSAPSEEVSPPPAVVPPVPEFPTVSPKRASMSTSLVLFKFDSCPYCRRVMRVVDELGISLEYRDTRQEPEARQELIQKTGRTQVPCLFIDGEPMFESEDIIDWLHQQFSG